MEKKFKTELHCHTGDTSLCGRATSEYLVSRYLEAGYSTIVVTDHFNKTNLDMSKKYLNYISEHDLKKNWNSKIDFFVNGYKNLKQAAEGKLNILLGMEFMSWEDKNFNDYLIFGVTEDWLRASKWIPDFTYQEMAIYAHEFGLKIYQAHPFRIKMSLADPKYLEGIEFYNGTVNVEANNSIAEIWAEHYGMKKISGSDFHEHIHKAVGGILTDHPIETNEQLLEVLSSETNYELIKDMPELM